jgi:hypothetical protein
MSLVIRCDAPDCGAAIYPEMIEHPECGWITIDTTKLEPEARTEAEVPPIFDMMFHACRLEHVPELAKLPLWQLLQKAQNEVRGFQNPR